MDDRHKTPRVFESGARKRKIALEREEKEKAILSKIRPLNEYFKAVDTNKINNIEIEKTIKDSETLPKTETENIFDIDQDENSMKKIAIEEQKEENENEKSAYQFDVGCWPNTITNDVVLFWASKNLNELQNCDKKVIADCSIEQTDVKNGRSFVRKCHTHLFERTIQNNEIIKRNWLCFSPSTGKIYCSICKLLATKKTQLSSDGFCDWKHAGERLMEHESSKDHLECLALFAKRRKEIECGNQLLMKEQSNLFVYWQKVVKRLISTIKFISERGLAFRGSNEIIGSPNNGNYLGIIELIAEYDPFLTQHLLEHANKGRGHVNYLSSTICEEIIKIMSERVLNEIIARIKKSKYFSISVDSTPDESNIDQLTVIVRYMDVKCPKERFISFIPSTGHTGSAIAESLLAFLGERGIDIKFCRGQAYDNAANMSGKYKGMQALILEKNNLAVFVPCFAHSLNLIGKAAANVCFAAVQFFVFLQNLYVFFSASTERYKVLTDKLSCNKTVLKVPKSLSETRWSCRADATDAFVKSYNQIKAALIEISENPEQKDIVRNEAAGLLNIMSSLEICLYSLFWNDILNRFNAVSKLLQNTNILFTSGIAALQSLLSFIASKRDSYYIYEDAAKKMSGTDEYTQTHTRSRTRNVRLTPLDYERTPPAQLSPSEKFRTESFLPVIDQLITSLHQRIDAYDLVNQRFGFLQSLETLSNAELRDAAEKLVNIYKDDLESCLSNELEHFCSIIKLFKDNYDGKMSKVFFYYNILIENNFSAAFPNVEVLLRMFLVLMITNCSGERSFSKMKLIKNRLRTTMSQDRLSDLTLLSIESDLLRELQFDDVICDFALKKARKKRF